MNFLDALETPATLPPNRVLLALHSCKCQPRPSWHRQSHDGAGESIAIWMPANKMDSGLRWNNGFDLEIEKLVELSGIEPLTSTMPL